MRKLLRLIVPEAMLVSYKERLRTATGTLLGILINRVHRSSHCWQYAVLPALIAQMGASAV